MVVVIEHGSLPAAGQSVKMNEIFAAPYLTIRMLRNSRPRAAGQARVWHGIKVEEGGKQGAWKRRSG